MIFELKPVNTANLTCSFYVRSTETLKELTCTDNPTMDDLET